MKPTLDPGQDSQCRSSGRLSCCLCRALPAETLAYAKELPMSVPDVIQHGVQQLQEWLKSLRDNADLADTTEALALLRVVLHQLRDRLTVDEAVDLGQQLPVIVRGIFYESWKPHHVPEKIHTRQAFVDAVTLKLLPRTIPADRAIRDVFALLAHYCDPGEIADVIAQLPPELKEMWPENARTFRQRTREAGH